MTVQDHQERSMPTRAEIIFKCSGIPIGQGAHRVSKTGHIYEIGKGHATWRQELVSRAIEAKPHDHVLITGAVEVVVTFIFPRLKGHYGTGKNAGVLKGGAPLAHTTSPDLDHLQRTLGDALKLAGLIKDDALICSWQATKIYGDEPGADIMITEI